jgi:hypothetical protein
MKYATRTVKRRGFRGLGGAFDMGATLVPGASQFNTTTPTEDPVRLVRATYDMVAPLTYPAPTPKTVLAPGMEPTIAYSDMYAPKDSEPYGPGGDDDVRHSPVTFGDFGDPVSDATGVSEASADVEAAHDDALSPFVEPPKDDEGFITDDSVRDSALSVRAPSGFPWWAWLIGGVVVVGGAVFVLRRR